MPHPNFRINAKRAKTGGALIPSFGLVIVAAEEAAVAKESAEQKLGDALERAYKAIAVAAALRKDFGERYACGEVILIA